MMKKYSRDDRSPTPNSAVTSHVMSANKAKNTSPELLLRKALCGLGQRNYRLHNTKLVGRPDVSFSKKKLAVFVHGCYWHHCSKCNLSLPKHNRAFWKKKFLRNQERDKEKLQELKKAGWKTVVIWEHELKKNPEKAARKVSKLLG